MMDKERQKTITNLTKLYYTLKDLTSSTHLTDAQKDQVHAMITSTANNLKQVLFMEHLCNYDLSEQTKTGETE